jgi:hypothetical protein
MEFGGWNRSPARTLFQGNDQEFAIQFTLKAADRRRRRSKNLVAVLSAGGLVDVAALNRAGSGHRIETAMAEMRASVSLVLSNYFCYHDIISNCLENIPRFLEAS